MSAKVQLPSLRPEALKTSQAFVFLLSVGGIGVLECLTGGISFRNLISLHLSVASQLFFA